MSEVQKLVDISPAAMVINVVAGKDIATELSLKNITNRPIAFKVKTTAPERYQVRPIQGIIEANSVVTCFIVMKAMQALPDFENPKETKHKFLVQTVEVPEGGVEDLTSYWKETEAKQKALGGSGIYLDQRIVCKLRPAHDDARAAAPSAAPTAVPTDYDSLFAFSTEQSNTIKKYINIKEQLTEEVKALNQTKAQLETRLSAAMAENSDFKSKINSNGGSKLWFYAFFALFFANVAVILSNYM